MLGQLPRVPVATLASAAIVAVVVSGGVALARHNSAAHPFSAQVVHAAPSAADAPKASAKVLARIVARPTPHVASSSTAVYTPAPAETTYVAPTGTYAAPTQAYIPPTQAYTPPPARTLPMCPADQGPIYGSWCMHSANGPDNPGYMARNGPATNVPSGFVACGTTGAICPKS